MSFNRSHTLSHGMTALRELWPWRQCWKLSSWSSWQVDQEQDWRKPANQRHDTQHSDPVVQYWACVAEHRSGHQEQFLRHCLWSDWTLGNAASLIPTSLSDSDMGVQFNIGGQKAQKILTWSTPSLWSVSYGHIWALKDALFGSITEIVWEPEQSCLDRTQICCMLPSRCYAKLLLCVFCSACASSDRDKRIFQILQGISNGI